MRILPVVTFVILTVAIPSVATFDVGSAGSYVGPTTRTAPFAASASVNTPSPNSDCDINCFSINASLLKDAAVAAGFPVSNPAY